LLKRLGRALGHAAKRRATGLGAATSRFGSGLRTRVAQSGIGPRLASGATRAGAGLRAGLPVLPRPRFRHFAWAAGVGALAVAGYLAYCIATLPYGGGLQVEATQSALVLEADNGEVFASRGVFKGDKLGPAEVPATLAKAVVAIEDRRFYDHWGVDVWGLSRAMWRNAQAGGAREGGSTITQQLARLIFLSQDKTLKRKIQEAMLAVWLEHQLFKEEILVRYLNTAYFGAGAYGVDAAAKRYFGKRAKDLSLSESAMLAGLVRAPSQLAPNRNMDGARERAATVLQAMVETAAITEDEAKAARAQPVDLRAPPETPPGTNYFVDMVGNDVKRLLGNAPADLHLRTTLDLDLQTVAENVIDKRLDAEGERKNVRQAALVAMAPDGAVLALVGGRDYEASQFNRATQAKRQAGSLFKLFVYQTAFQKGYTPGSVLIDRPTQIGDWEPQNASGRYRGRVDLRTAFANSINTVAAQLADEVGIPAVIDTAKRMGVTSELPVVPSLALGSAEVTLLEMTRAYAAVAANVQSVEPYGVRAIQGTGQVLYTKPAPATAPDAGASRAMMADLLAAVVREGTGRAARLPSQAAAGKTGTTQENRDAWFVGYTPDLVVGVWVGNDDNTPMNGVTGGDLPAVIWREFMGRAGPILARKRPGAMATVQVASARPVAGDAAVTSAVPAGSTPASAVRGRAEVVDTGTLQIKGSTVRLLGVEGLDGRFARELGRFLRRRDIACEPTTGSPELHRCQVDGQDLSTVILAAGGARAAPDAPPEMVQAEDEARTSRAGVWRRRR
jgi:1A family penicillin-binding protein